MIFIDRMRIIAVLVSLAIHSLLGWWWADRAAGCVAARGAFREAISIVRPTANVL